MKKRFVLDACALIAFLNDEEGADEKGNKKNLPMLLPSSIITFLISVIF